MDKDIDVFQQFASSNCIFLFVPQPKNNILYYKVIVSVGTMSASGGVWSTANADEIFALPASIVGEDYGRDLPIISFSFSFLFTFFSILTSSFPISYRLNRSICNYSLLWSCIIPVEDNFR